MQADVGRVLPPDFHWRAQSSSWGSERALYVRGKRVGVVSDVGDTCFVSHRSTVDFDEWVTLRAPSAQTGIATVERWANAHVRPLRLLRKEKVTSGR